MKPLEPPDSLNLQAAQGWLELGNQVEAMLNWRSWPRSFGRTRRS